MTHLFPFIKEFKPDISKMKTSTLFLLLWLSTINIYAKEITLYGRVKDINNNSIVGATIQCFHHDSILIYGSISDNQGNFSIKVQQIKDYTIVVSCIGYKKTNIYLKDVNSNTKIEDIILEETSVKLNDVTITAQQIVHTPNKLIIYPTKQQLRHSVGGYEALSNLLLPQLNVDPFNKKVTTRNKEVTLCINGRKATDTEVQDLNPDDILRINFYDTGNPNYPDAHAVIDYILIQHEKGGSITVNGEQHLNKTTGNYNSTGQLFKKKSEFAYNITGMFDHQDLNPSTNELIHFIYPDKILTRKTIGLSTGKHNNALNSYINYTYKGDKTLFYTSLRYNQSEKKADNHKYQQYDNESSEKVFWDNTIMENLNPAVELFYDHKLNKKQSLTISLLSSYNYNKYSYHYSELYRQQEEHPDIQSLTKENFFLMNTRMTYIKTFNNKGMLSIMLGYDQNNTYRKQFANRTKKTEDYLLYSEFPIQLVYQQKIENISFMLRWGNSFNTRKNKNNATINNFSINPKININYQINENQYILFDGQYTETNQQMTWLTKAEQEIDYLQIRRGNPNLKNIKYMELYLAYSLNWKWGTIMPQIVYTSLFDALYETVFREKEVFVHSYYTGGTEKGLTSVLALRLKLIPQILTMKMDIGWEKRWYTTWENASFTSWTRSNAGLVFMYKDFIATADIEAPRKNWGLGDMTKTPLTYRFNVGYNHNNLHLQFGTRNPFSRIKKNIIFSTPEYKNESNLYIPKAEDHIFYLKLNYRFNFGKQHEFFNAPAGNTSKSAILKAY